MKKLLKKILVSPWTALLTLGLVVAVRLVDPTFVESVRLVYFDRLIVNKPATENNIVTVNIDEAALDKYGQWPFDRRVYAEFISDLYKRNAGLVVFNVLMPEKDRMNGDSELIKVLKDTPVILGSIPAAKDKNEPHKPGMAILNSQFVDRVINYPGLISNIKEIEDKSLGVGIVGTLPEVDGVNRRIPLVIGVNGKLYPSLSMEVLRVAAGDSTVQVKLSELGIDKMRIPKFGPITTDAYGRIWIDWSQTNKSYSITDLPKDLDGAIVIVGVSASGLGNPVPTAKGAVFPQDVQAAVVGTLINGVNIERPDYADGAEVIALLLGGIILLILTRWVYIGLGSVIVMVAAGVYGSFWMFSNNLVLWDITAFTAGIVLVSLHAYGVKFVSEFLQKQQIKKQFGTYLSPDLVAQLQRNPDLLQLGGDSTELSIMFTDVRGFTTISEHYGKDVQGLTKIMNRYMTAMTKKILENRGTLDKYIGDAQMAFWNAPISNPQHAKDAVKTALEMLGSLDAFNKEIAEEGVPPFGMGLGINTGTVVVGNMGSAQRFDYTCLGDAVNLASRLEGQSKPYHVAMVIGPITNEYVKDEYFTLELDCLAVKGKTEGVNVFTVLSVPQGKEKKYQEDKVFHNNMLTVYRDRKFKQSKTLAQMLKGRFDKQMDDYYDMWMERCDDMIKNDPGPGWDGIYRTNTK